MPWLNNVIAIDALSVKLNGDKVQKQKQLVLCNLKEAYIKFKETHPIIETHFSKSSRLPERQKCCFLFSACGTYITCVCVCVCEDHQDMKRMTQVIDKCS
jgi:hypothetical protein